MSFNPCFNGSMYKNESETDIGGSGSIVSILVLMDLCIKTLNGETVIKSAYVSFNPCFNGSMYKNY